MSYHVDGKFPDMFRGSVLTCLGEVSCHVVGKCLSC